MAIAGTGSAEILANSSSLPDERDGVVLKAAVRAVDEQAGARRAAGHAESPVQTAGGVDGRKGSVGAGVDEDVAGRTVRQAGGGAIGREVVQ